MSDMEKLKELYADPRHEILSEMARLLDSSRIWSGMEYSYHPIHPVKYLPLRNKVAEELRKLAVEHGMIMSQQFDCEEQPDEIQYCPTCGEEWSGTSCGIDDCGWITK